MVMVRKIKGAMKGQRVSYPVRGSLYLAKTSKWLRRQHYFDDLVCKSIGNLYGMRYLKQKWIFKKRS